MKDQRIYDIKDLRHIADEIEPGLNVYAQILRRIADRVEGKNLTEKAAPKK